MTREEAKVYMTFYKQRLVNSVAVAELSEDIKAFDVAIKALEQEPVLDKIKAEIEKMPSELTADGRRMVRRENVFRIIDKHREKGR